MTLETVTAMALKLCQVHNSKVGQSQQQQQQHFLLLLLLVQPTEVAFATLKWHGTDRGREGMEAGRGQDKQRLCKADKAWRGEGVTIY